MAAFSAASSWFAEKIVLMPQSHIAIFSHMGNLDRLDWMVCISEVTEQIGNLFHEKDRISDYICNFVSDIKVLYSELYLIIKILS